MTEALKFLTQEGIVQALNNTGYYTNIGDVQNLRFVGMTETAKAIYHFNFKDDEGEMSDGSLFVWSDKDGKLQADF